MTDHAPEYRVVEDDLWEPEISELLELHLAELQVISPPGRAHSMSIERLREPDVTFFSAWDEDILAGCGALQELDRTHGEIKAVRAAAEYRGKGAGRAVLEHIIAEARDRGYARLSLETGRTEPFEAALRLYRSHGFAPCEPFGDYVPGDFSMCMTRAL